MRQSVLDATALRRLVIDPLLNIEQRTRDGELRFDGGNVGRDTDGNAHVMWQRVDDESGVDAGEALGAVGRLLGANVCVTYASNAALVQGSIRILRKEGVEELTL